MSDRAQATARSELDTSMLLPPTYFAVPTPRSSSHDPLWTRSALQEELDRLRAEVVELRQRRPLSPSVSDVAFAAGGGSSISILNEVLMQQTNELSRLRSEAENMKDRHNQEISNLQMQVETHRIQMIEKEDRFENRLKVIEEDYERQIREKNTEIDELVKQYDEKLQSWRNHSEKSEEEFARKIGNKDLRITELCQTNEFLNEQIRELQSKLNRANEDIEKLRICESWAVDRGDIVKQNEELERQLENSESANDLKQQRLNTLQTVLSIQEKEIAKFGPSEKQEAVAALLGRWREKVFSLMIQAESTRLVFAKDVQNYRTANVELERLLDHTRCIATTNELKLNACHAEVQDEMEKRKQSNRQLAEARETLGKVTSERDSLVSSLSILRRAVESSVRGLAAQEREVTSKALTSMNSMDRRIQNVVGRLPVLKAQLKRLQAKEAVTQVREEFESRLQSLQQELNVVRADRDRLANNMEKDAEEAGCRERNLRGEYETEINFLARKCDNLLGELESKSQRIETIESEVVDLQKYSGMVQKENDELKSALSAVEGSRDELVRITTTQLYEEHSQQMAQLQTTLDEVRREHTTTVMALRQTERDLEKLQSEQSSKLAEVREESDRQRADLQMKMGNLEAERNLLKATVRQQGLLRPTSGPILDTPLASDCRVSQSPKDDLPTPKKKPPNDFGPHLANLIEEVRSLVRSVEDADDHDISDDEFD